MPSYSKAHIKSKLSINKVPIPIDSSTSFLCHYDICTTDVHDIKPTVDTSILTGMNQRAITNNNGSLVAGYDGKYGGAVACFEAATNIVPHPTLLSTGWESYTNGYDGIIINEFGIETINIVNRQSWCGASIPITLPAAGTYTLSVYVKVISRSDPNINATLYTGGGGISDTHVNADFSDSKIGVWQRISITDTFTTTSVRLYLICFGGSNAPGYTISAQYCMPQIEAGSYTTHIIDGSRVASSLLYDGSIININEGTYACWFKPGDGFFSSSTAWNRIIGHSTAVNKNEIQIMRANNTSNITFNLSNNAGTPVSAWDAIRSTTTLQKDIWYFLAATWSKSGGFAKLYINGVPEDSETGIVDTSFPSVMGNVGVGYHQQYAGRILNGYIDEVRIDTVARTDEEIMSWYVSQCPFYYKERYKVVR